MPPRDGELHTGMLVYGNEAKGRWAATPIMQPPDAIASRAPPAVAIWKRMTAGQSRYDGIRLRNPRLEARSFRDPRCT
jgi:hypothetical protein